MQDYHHFLQLRYKRQYHLTHITSNHAESSAPCVGASSEAPFSC